ncbi:MAG: SPOR domain-containing protein [Mangrovibacterium sp.]
MELLAYIKELLLLNDCVIIPGFGGFVTNYKQAGLQSSQFTPPGKSVSFNKKLNFNDGLLINHIASEEGINYIAARKKVDLMVQELNYRLTDGEEINIPGLGALTYDEQQHLVFTPRVEGNLNLDAFGLGAFNYETLFSRQMARKAAVHQHERQTAVEVIFQKRSLKKVLIAVPLLFALAVIPLKNNLSHLQQSDISGFRELVTAPAALTTSAQTSAEEAQVRAEEAAANAIETPAVIAEQTPTRYFLIVGSFKNPENAETYINQLSKKGYSGTNMGLIRGLHYISLGGFATIDKALEARTNYENESGPGSGSWIYKKVD